MLQKSLFTIISMTLLTSVACSNSPHRPKMNKNITSGKSVVGISQNKAINKIVSENKGCLRLDKIVDQLARTQANDFFTVHVQSRHLLERDSYSKDAKVNFGILVNNGLRLVETFNGSELVKLSTLVGDLLAVKNQSNCEDVLFQKSRADTTDGSTFSVQRRQITASSKDKDPSTPGLLSLKNKNSDETREYRIVGDNLVIDVTDRVPGIEACDKTTPAYVTMRTKYVLNLSGADSGMTLHARFAELLAGSLVVSSQFTAQLQGNSTTNSTSTSGQRTPPRPDTVSNKAPIPVSYTTLDSFSRQIIKGDNFKAIQCK